MHKKATTNDTITMHKINVVPNTVARHLLLFILLAFFVFKGSGWNAFVGQLSDEKSMTMFWYASSFVLVQVWYSFCSYTIVRIYVFLFYFDIFNKFPICGALHMFYMLDRDKTQSLLHLTFTQSQPVSTLIMKSTVMLFKRRKPEQCDSFEIYSHQLWRVWVTYSSLLMSFNAWKRLCY